MLTFRNGFFTVLCLAFLLLGLTEHPANAQGLGNSLYSTQGIGEIYGDNNITNLGMGGLGVSYANSFFLNSVNPALLARNRNTIFEIGLLGQNRSISDNQGKNQKSFGANLSYLMLAFPVTSRWSAGFGLRPYSYIDYETARYQTVPGVTIGTSSNSYEATYSYRGRGALNKAMFTNGFHLGKNFYAGFEAGLLFGNTLTNSESQLSAPTGTNYSLLRSVETSYLAVVWKLGAAWRPKINKDWYLNVGATVDSPNNVRARQTSTSGQYLSGTVVTLDTTGLVNRGSMYLPAQGRFGLSIEKNLKFTAGVEVKYQPWSQFNSVGNPSGELRDSYTMSAGVAFIPKLTSSRYFDLINYRFGATYAQLPYVINKDQAKDVSASLGVSLPVGQFVNSVTISLIGGQRGVFGSTLLRERYFRVGLGFSLNQRWFERYKVD